MNQILWVEYVSTVSGSGSVFYETKVNMFLCFLNNFMLMEKGDFIHFVSLFDIDSACETTREGASGWSGYMFKRKQPI